MEVKPYNTLSRQIEAYLDGYLLDEELDKFERLLNADPDLAFEVEKVRVARMMIKNEALREKLKTIQSELIFEKIFSGKSKSIWKYAALFLIAMLAVILVFKIFLINNDILFAENYRTYDLNPISINKPENSILYNYAQKNYQDVVTIYENNPDRNNEMNFFAGVSYLQLDRPDSAISALLKILEISNKGGDHSYLQDAEYYIGFAYLKANNVDFSDWYIMRNSIAGFIGDYDC
jgi:tetratricopeptide (TPR) repeat protein